LKNDRDPLGTVIELVQNFWWAECCVFGFICFSIWAISKSCVSVFRILSMYKFILRAGSNLTTFGRL
jgi:hypothetical protein